MSSEKEAIVPKSQESASTTSNTALYHDSSQSPQMASQDIGKPFALHNIDQAIQRKLIPDQCLKAHAQSLCVGKVLKCIRRMCQLLFVGLVVVMVIITISLSIYHGVDASNNGFMYFLLGVNLIGFVVLEIFMIIFVRRGDLPKGKTWFLYFVGGAVILESIFTNVALFR